MTQFDDDIDTMLADFDPKTLVFGSYAGNAIRDEWDADVLPGTEKGVVVELIALLVKTSAFPGLKIGSSVTLYDQDANGQRIEPGASYRVRDRARPIESADGALTHLLLANA